MAKKNRIPKKIAGIKLPRPLRNSKVLRALLADGEGRRLLAHLLVAGASAVAVTLVRQRHGSRRTRTDASQAAAAAVKEVLRERRVRSNVDIAPQLTRTIGLIDRQPNQASECDEGSMVERLLVSKYGNRAVFRLLIVASVRAISVLVRDHPLIAARLLGIGVAQAALVGMVDIKRYLKGHRNVSGALGSEIPEARTSVPLIGCRSGRRRSD